jgi:hypothetical protein
MIFILLFYFNILDMNTRLAAVCIKTYMCNKLHSKAVIQDQLFTFVHNII